MKNKKHMIIFTIILICLSTGSFAVAQSDDTKRVEVTAGYSRTQTGSLISFSPQSLTQIPNAANGWTGGAGYKVNKRFAVYAEGGQDYGKLGDNYFTTNATRTTILGGIRFYLVNRSRLTPFVNGGAGYARLLSESHYANGTHTSTPPISKLMFAGGGGVDIALNKKRTVSWRTGVEYRRYPAADNVTLFATNGKGTGNAMRFNTGIVLGF